jgi:hypothetical protein
MGGVVAVTRERGKWLRRADGRRVLITLHPSALLRMEPEDKEAAWKAWLADLKKAAAARLRRAAAVRKRPPGRLLGVAFAPRPHQPRSPHENPRRHPVLLRHLASPAAAFAASHMEKGASAPMARRLDEEGDVHAGMQGPHGDGQARTRWPRRTTP